MSLQRGWTVRGVLAVGVVGFILSFANSIDGAPYYFRDAVRQVHAMNLLPEYAVVDQTAPSVQVAQFSIGPKDRASLHEALGGTLPYDVVRSLEQQLDTVGRYHLYPHY